MPDSFITICDAISRSSSNTASRINPVSTAKQHFILLLLHSKLQPTEGKRE